MSDIDWTNTPSGIQAEIDAYGWRDVALELRRLGFKPCADFQMVDGEAIAKDGGDFIAMDDRDPSEGFPHGHGPYIAHWLSVQPCPIPEMVAGEHGHPQQPEPPPPTPPEDGAPDV